MSMRSPCRAEIHLSAHNRHFLFLPECDKKLRIYVDKLSRQTKLQERKADANVNNVSNHAKSCHPHTLDDRVYTVDE